MKPSPPHADLGRAASSSAFIAGGGQIARLVLQVAGIVVLGRLLTPADYGLLAIAVAVSGLGEMLRDFGLANASVQAATLSRRERDNLFWVNTLLGVVLAGAAALAAPLISAAFGEPRVDELIKALAVGFVINGIGTQYRASLTREMRFLSLNVIDTIALAVSLVVAIVLAATGAGVWALIVMLLSQSATQVVLAIAAARWMPGLPHRGTSIRSFMGYGAGLFGTQLLGYASKNANTVVIGLVVGVVPLGLYNRASQLLNLPLAQLQAPATQVALPVLSRLQDDQPRFDRFLLRGQTVLLNITSMVLGLSAGIAVPLFTLVLGAQWTAAAPIYQILAIGGFGMVAGYAAYWVFLARGATVSQLRLSLIIQPLAVLAVVVGGLFGIYGIVTAYAVTSILIWPFTLWWLRRATQAPVGEMFGNGIRTLVPHASGGLLASVGVQFAGAGSLLDALIGVAIYCGTVALWAALWPRFRADLAGVLDLVRLARRKIAPSAG